MKHQAVVKIFDVAFIKLSRGMWAKADIECLDRIANRKWYARAGHGTYYAVSDSISKGERMHRVITGGLSDHLNHNGLDNRLGNLRPCTTRENGFNKRRRADNTSGFKGVSRACGKQGWRAYIVVDGKQTSLGVHKTPELAHEAYKEAAKCLHGEFAFTGER